MKIGHGYDVHKFSFERKLVLGGVEIPFKMGLLGHSDADVLIHAIMDSLLGASTMENIGALFPDSDEKYKDSNSLMLLREVCELVYKEGYEICNIDSTIIAQSPKLSPYLYQMRENISRVCGINIRYIGVKATTEEGLGFTGTMQGIAAHAVCLIN